MAIQQQSITIRETKYDIENYVPVALAKENVLVYYPDGSRQVIRRKLYATDVGLKLNRSIRFLCFI
jgi:hypothetical protein